MPIAVLAAIQADQCFPEVDAIGMFFVLAPWSSERIIEAKQSFLAFVGLL
jgi:hypothetical protein